MCPIQSILSKTHRSERTFVPILRLSRSQTTMSLECCLESRVRLNFYVSGRYTFHEASLEISCTVFSRTLPHCSLNYGTGRNSQLTTIIPRALRPIKIIQAYRHTTLKRATSTPSETH